MKIRIAVKEDENKNKLTLFNDYEIVYISDNMENELNARFDDSEAEIIMIDEALDYTSIKDRMKKLRIVLKKLRIGGSVIITGIDAYSVSKDYISLKLNTEQFNNIVFNERKKSLTSIEDIKNDIKQIGRFKLTTVDSDGYFYIIEATREV